MIKVFSALSIESDFSLLSFFNPILLERKINISVRFQLEMVDRPGRGYFCRVYSIECPLVSIFVIYYPISFPINERSIEMSEEVVKQISRDPNFPTIPTPLLCIDSRRSSRTTRTCVIESRLRRHNGVASWSRVPLISVAFQLRGRDASTPDEILKFSI